MIKKLLKASFLACFSFFVFGFLLSYAKTTSEIANELFAKIEPAITTKISGKTPTEQKNIINTALTKITVTSDSPQRAEEIRGKVISMLTSKYQAQGIK
jgi:hypothetical protein